LFGGLIAATSGTVKIHVEQADGRDVITKSAASSCMCGCNEALPQCNHVGCTVSTSMLKEVDQAFARRF
jgi:hypothetical protein